MPLANIFLLCSLVFLDTPSIRVFFQESQSQEARPKPDQAQEAPKAAQTEPSKPGQSTPPAPDQQTQSPPAASEPPQPPPAEPAAGSTEKKSTAATSRTAGRTESNSQIHGASEDSRCIWRLATRAQPCFQGTAAF